MTYLEYHLLFNVPLILVLLLAARRRLTAARLRALGIVLPIVVAFTYPWDSWAVSEGIWFFGEGRVAAWIGNLPVEEVSFFILESVAASLFLFLLLPPPSDVEIDRGTP